MSTIQEIEAAIKSLPREEMAKLWQWWDEYREAEWDRQIEKDAEPGGPLDRLAKKAIEDFHAGRTKKLP